MNARVKDTPAIAPAWYPSPINLPEGRSGKVRITHRMLTGTTPIIGFRQAIVRGMTPVSAKLSEPLRIHQLVHDDRGLWMTDLPEELNQIAEMLAEVEPCGDVLIGGLGLGIVASIVAMRGSVNQVVVVEKDRDIIRLVHPPFVEARTDPDDFKVVHSGIHGYLLKSEQRFDYYLLDTWQATSEAAWWSQVMPLKRAIRNKWGASPVVHCWAEDMMHGQIRATMLRGNRTWHYEGLPKSLTERQVDAFLRDVGTPEWEARYGRIYPKKKARRGT